MKHAPFLQHGIFRFYFPHAHTRYIRKKRWIQGQAAWGYEAKESRSECDKYIYVCQNYTPLQSILPF